MKKFLPLISLITLISLISLISLASAQAPTLPAQTHRNGELINETGTIYLIKDGKRWGFRTAGEFFSHGYKFEQALLPLAGDLALPVGDFMSARPGSLVQDNRTKDYYLIYDDKAHLIFTPLLFALGFGEAASFEVNLFDYKRAPALDAKFSLNVRPAGTLIREGYGIYLLTGAGKQPFPSWEVFASFGYDEEMVLVGNAKELSLPTLEAAKYRNGTLVKESRTIFLISDGKKYGFRTWEGFVRRGYQLNTVIDGSAAGYAEGESFD